MLSRVGIKRFRLLRDATLDFPRGHPLVLIGPNASGKSTFLEVIDLAGKAASEERGLVTAFQQKGGFDHVRTRGEAGTIVLQFVLDPSSGSPIEPDGGTVKYSLEIGDHRGGLHVEKERIEVFKRGQQAPPLVALSRLGGNVTVHNVSTWKNDEIPVSDDELSWFEIRQPQLYPTLGNVRAALRLITVHSSFLWPPAWARDPRALAGPRASALLSQQSRLDSCGQELIPALYNLERNHPETWKQLEHSFQAEFPFVKRITFPADAGAGRVALVYEDQRFGGVRFYAQEWSDGMLTYLAVLAATLIPDHGTAVALDEPDAHIHPSAQHRLASLLEEVAEHTPVVVATHSDRFIDCFSEPGQSIRVCEPSSSGTQVRILSSKALEAWLEDYSISDLRRRGHIDPANSDTVE